MHLTDSWKGIALVCALVGLGACNRSDHRSPEVASRPQVPASVDTLEAQLTPVANLETAYADRQSDLPVRIKGLVEKFLPDDTEGSKHQRLIVRLSNGQTLLIAHNIDLAPRIPVSALDQTIYASGIYEWNRQGGVVHWTHHDPRGLHPGGWIQFEGTRYQ